MQGNDKTGGRKPRGCGFRADEADHVPTPPARAELTEAQRRWWRPTCKALIESGQIKRTNIDVIARYCVLKAAAQDLIAIIEKEGYTVAGDRGGVRAHPASEQLRKVETQLRALETDLCFSPMARAKADNDKKPETAPAPKLRIGGGS